MEASAQRELGRRTPCTNRRRRGPWVHLRARPHAHSQDAAAGEFLVGPERIRGAFSRQSFSEPWSLTPDKPRLLSTSRWTPCASSHDASSLTDSPTLTIPGSAAAPYARIPTAPRLSSQAAHGPASLTGSARAVRLTHPLAQPKRNRNRNRIPTVHHAAVTATLTVTFSQAATRPPAVLAPVSYDMPVRACGIAVVDLQRVLSCSPRVAWPLTRWAWLGASRRSGRALLGLQIGLQDARIRGGGEVVGRRTCLPDNSLLDASSVFSESASPHNATVTQSIHSSRTIHYNQVVDTRAYIIIITYHQSHPTPHHLHPSRRR